MLRVHLLGGLALEVEGAPIEPPTSKRARSVLAWLALNGGPHPRVEVAGRFWPDLTDSSARGNLRLAIWAIRRALGPAADSCLLATRDQVGLVANGAMWVDLLEFRRLVQEGRNEEALELCRGEPLADLEDEWVYEPREEHREQVVEALGRLATQAEARGEVRDAIAWTRRQVALDPLGEEVARDLMRRLGAAGDRGAALATFERLCERLERELGIAPSRATREIAYRLGADSGEEPVPPPRTPIGRRPSALPAGLTRAERSAFVGRRRELEGLRAELQRAWAGELRVVLLGGEAGIGKTRLATELARDAAARGASVLLGHNDEEAVVPFQPFVEALRRYVQATGLEELREVIGDDDARELARLVPELERRLPPARQPEGRPEAERYRMFEAVSSLLGQVSAAAPVALVLEDLHWAERPTLLLLKHIARSTDAAALLVLATFREAEPGGRSDLADVLADLRRDATVTRLSLEGLGEAEVGELIASWSDLEPPAALVRSLHRDTGGNPFFLQETLRHLDDAGILRVQDGQWSRVPIEQVGVAEGVKEVVARRLATLGAACRRLLDLGAVIGRIFELELLERLSGSPADAVAETLEDAVRARILSEEEDAAGLHYVFSHALIRQTLYENLPRSRRIRLHRAIADAIEDLHSADLDPRLGDLAYHVLRSARPRDAKRALAYARRAGAQAMDLLAYEDAAAHFRRALEALELSPQPSDEARCEVLLDLGSALAKSGDSEEAAAALEAAASTARQLARHDLLARAALGFAGTWALTRMGLEPRSVAVLEEALAALGESEPVLRARVLTRLSEELYYSPARERRAALSAEALRLVRRSGDRAALAMALGARHTAIWGQRPVTDRLKLASEMSRLGQDANDPEIAFQGAAWSYADLVELGRVDEADAALERVVALADELRQPAYRWWAHMLRAGRAGTAGDFDEAEAHNEESAFWGRRATTPTAMYAPGQLHYLRVDQGRSEEMVDTMRRLVRDYRAIPSLRAMLAETCAESGLEDEARRELRAMADDETAMLMMNASWSIGMYSLSMACSRLGEADIAQRLYEPLLAYEPYCHVAFRASYSTGSVARALGLLAATAGNTEQAERHLARAVEVNEKIGALCQLARARHDYGLLLHNAGRADEAEPHLASARALAERLGMRGPKATR